MGKILKLAVIIIVCLSIGLIGSVFTFSSIPTWYATLTKPVFSPPNWLFGPVWTVLYILMGISLYLILEKGLKTEKVRHAVFVFALQLFLNAIWSPIFFGARNILLALFVIVILWFYIVEAIISFARINKVASYLLYPYLLWVTFASVLNFSVWILNR